LAGDDRVDQITLAQTAVSVDGQFRSDGVQVSQRAGLERFTVEY
jgi:hypothetical protein